MNQAAFPFHETAEDATNTAIIRSGKHFKEVALALWPEMKMDSAYAKLKNSLRPETREHLTADQHVFIGKYVSQFDFIFYACHNSCLSQPELIKPEDEKAALQREFIQYAKQMKQISNRIEGLNT